MGVPTARPARLPKLSVKVISSHPSNPRSPNLFWGKGILTSTPRHDDALSVDC